MLKTGVDFGSFYFDSFSDKNGRKVKSKAGLLRKALEEGIVQVSQGTPKGIIVLEPTGEWTPFKTMLEKGWTLEYLVERVKR